MILIGHIPPGDLDNNADYGERYLNVTKKFKNTIIGHLFGHTHMDHFQLVSFKELHWVVMLHLSVQPVWLNVAISAD